MILTNQSMDLIIASESLIRFWQITFVVAAGVQFFYFAYFYLRLAMYKPSEQRNSLPPVSIVIAARNEYDNLLANLPSVLDQDYPEFEVIVVNDSSFDESDFILQGYQSTYPNLRVVERKENERFDGGKKLAVTLGIKAAKHSRLLLTDADCKPNSRNWIRAMVGAGENEQIILGYSPYAKSKGVLNALIRFDGLMTAMNYFGYALAGIPYMGVGRNLSYPKETFFSVGGFKKHYSIQSGDDDLLINEIANAENTAICLEQDAVVETIPEDTWKNFWRQKKRHLTTGWRYRRHHKWLLAIQPISFLLFVISTVSLLAYQVWFYAVLSVVFLRILTQIAIFSRSAKRLGQRDLVIFAPILEIIILVMSTCVHFANASSNRTTWKTKA